jgi:hypothetical protein
MLIFIKNIWKVSHQKLVRRYQQKLLLCGEQSDPFLWKIENTMPMFIPIVLEASIKEYFLNAKSVYTGKELKAKSVKS